MMERPAWAPPDIDLTVPSVARIYDYYLGGSHNVEADRSTGIVAADFRRPADVIGSEPVARLMDLRQPVALLLVALLHFVEDADDPCRAVAEYRDALAPGSLLVVTHASRQDGPERGTGATEVSGVYRGIGSPLIMRSRAEVERFFDGFEILEPGVVPCPRWRPDGTDAEPDPAALSGLAGVGRAA
jgi:S-adenosyl methyltransferase